MRFILALLISSVLVSPKYSLASAPLWARENTMTRTGKRLRVVGTGKGLSLELARAEATQACESAALNQVQSNVEVKSQSIESETTTVFSQAISHNGNYSGLVCNPEREAVETEGSETVVYLLCSFDLAKVKAMKNKIESNHEEINTVENANQVDQVPMVSKKIRSHDGIHRTSNRQLLLLTVPGLCESVKVETRSVPQIFRCTSNPQLITVDTKDKITGITVSPKAHGYLPRTYKIAGSIPESMDVQFEQH
jgi:hypothetical protein